MRSLKFKTLEDFGKFLEEVSNNDKINDKILVCEKSEGYHMDNRRDTCCFLFENEKCYVCCERKLNSSSSTGWYKFNYSCEFNFPNNPNMSFIIDKIDNPIGAFNSDVEIGIKNIPHNNYYIYDHITEKQALRFLQCVMTADFETLTNLIKNQIYDEPFEYKVEFDI